ncbi:helix-turn-helix domain-containing protein [Novosphingobium sp. ZN18A2]|uniref:helix-turn-helix domain-containing protein n=1 Tax=Novosphingobium sp. ZN18A2 TaxID=3079861 RepID=UPI0030CFDCA3
MYVDPKKMKAARDRRALTQEALASQARVNVRTIQRAESGHPIQAETLAEIAAVLGLPPSGLIVPGPVKEQEVLAAEADEGQTQVLKRVDSGEMIIATLERSLMVVLGCSAEPTAETMPALRTLIKTLERLFRDPCDVEKSPPLTFYSLLDRLDAVVALNTALADVERNGMALFMATSTAYVKVPYRGEEGYMITRTGQWPEYVTAARFMIAEYQSERIRVSKEVRWPLSEEDIPSSSGWPSTEVDGLKPAADDLDGDIPF